MNTYIKDTERNEWHKLGEDRHDSLYVDPVTNGLQYHNMQNGGGSRSGIYVFCDKNGNDLRESLEDYNYIGIGASLEPMNYARELAKRLSEKCEYEMNRLQYQKPSWDEAYKRFLSDIAIIMNEMEKEYER